MLNGGGSGGHLNQHQSNNQNYNHHHSNSTKGHANISDNVPPCSKVHHGSHSLSTSHIHKSSSNGINSSSLPTSSTANTNDYTNKVDNSDSNNNSDINGFTSSSHIASPAIALTKATDTPNSSIQKSGVAGCQSITNNNNNNNNNSNNPIVANSKALMLTNGNGLYKVFSTESVLNLLHCLYCKKPYRDPRLLHCGHTYCLACLIQMNRYSTIRCIKCNSLHTVTSHAVDSLPKNLFVADIQCIPTVEIDRGAAYKETLKSLEDLKLKLLDFSDRFDQSEEKLVHLTEIKKIEVSQQISRVIDQIRQLEEELHNEIEEFKNNRLSVLRSAPPEFKETNANLLQFVNQSLNDMMRNSINKINSLRPDIKEEDVKEIYNRCEEHRRLWNETEIIFNSNYAIGEIHFALNEKPVTKEIIGNVFQKLPQKLSAQKTAKGPISISECCADGDYIVIENTSKRHDVNMTNWVLTHCVGSVRKISFKFPDAFILKSRQSVKMWAGNKTMNVNNSNPNSTSNSKLNGSNSLPSSQNSSSSSLSGKSPLQGTQAFYLNGHLNSENNGSLTTSIIQQQQTGTSVSSAIGGTSSTNDLNYTDSIENELIIYDVENWICGAQEIFIRLENEFGEEKASFRKTN